MEQLILDIHSESDAALIKDFLKKLKNVDVHSFSSSLSQNEIRERIQKGLEDADQGKVTPWETVKAKINQQIENHRSGL